MSAGGQGQIQLFRSTAGGPVRWRLLSGNNREMGRSTISFADPAECQRAVVRTQERSAELVTALRRVDLHRWAWEVRLADDAIVGSGHTFDRQVRCRSAVAQFLAAFPDAGIRAVIVVSGARRWERAAS